MRAIIYRDETDALWIAQGLEHDIGAEAGDVQQLAVEWVRMIQGCEAIAADHGRTIGECYRRAPERFWTMFREATPDLLLKWGDTTARVAAGHGLQALREATTNPSPRP